MAEEETTESTDAEEDDGKLDFDEELFLIGREKIRLTRREKCAEQQKYQLEGANKEGETDDQPLEVIPHALDISMEELKTLQKTDDTLKEIRKAADQQPSTAGVGFYRNEGLLYRRWVPPGRDTDSMALEQLVLPLQCRETLLDLAHSIPIAGHMGKDKTARRILQHFYWPTLYRDVASFCRRCAVCQKTIYYKPHHAPMYLYR